MTSPFEVYRRCGKRFSMGRYIMPVGSETLPHKVGPNEDVRDLSGGDCDAPI